MNPLLFNPINLSGLTLNNRIIISPMCQYSAIEGNANDWHLMHIGKFAVSGAGMMMVEATAVQPEGRITPYCLTLCSDENEAALKRIVDFAKTHGRGAIGIQLAHAGRKASCDAPWNGGAALTEDAGGWMPVGPSAIAFNDQSPIPVVLDKAGIEQIKSDFVQAAQRAVRAGFDSIELHFAHGYLVHEFLSPISNQRTDEYGGDLPSRLRLAREIFAAVKEVVPASLPLGARISATDYVKVGWNLEEATQLVAELKKLGLDYIDVSSGALVPWDQMDTVPQNWKPGPNYQVEFAAHIKKHTGVATMAVGMITGPQQAETILSEAQADMIAIGRVGLYSPHWPVQAADALGGTVVLPDQYEYTMPSRWRGLIQP